MPDTKLSALLSSSAPCNFYYGIDASNNSRKFASPGFYNVKDYGAVGNGGNDDTSAIQAAVDAAATDLGGIIFFPKGIYKITNSITFNHNSQAALRIIGVGGQTQFAGSRIQTDQRIWMFQTDHGPIGDQGGGLPFQSIEHITFENTFDPGVPGTITSTEAAGGGFGCVYMTAGLSTRYVCCGFQISKAGIGLFDTGIGTVVTGCYFSGPFGTYTNAQDSIGVILANGYVGDGKIQAFGLGILGYFAFSAAQVMIENLDIETSGCAILLGETPIATYSQYYAATSSALAGVSYARICNIACESIGDTDSSSIGAVCKIRGGQIVLQNCLWRNLNADTNYGLWISAAVNIKVENLFTSDNLTFGFTLGGVYIESIGNCQFFGCTIISNHGPSWILPTSTSWQPDTTCVEFKGCNTDGAIPFVDLPTQANIGTNIACSNSVDPAWDGGAGTSNVGKPITAGGGNKVIAHWNGTDWVIGG